MILNQEYSIESVVKMNPSGNVIIFIRNIYDTLKLYKVYLPIQYAHVVSDKDNDEINNE